MLQHKLCRTLFVCRRQQVLRIAEHVATITALGNCFCWLRVPWVVRWQFLLGLIILFHCILTPLPFISSIPLVAVNSLSISSRSGDSPKISRSLSRTPLIPLDLVRPYNLRHALAYLPCSDLASRCLLASNFTSRSHTSWSMWRGWDPPFLINLNNYPRFLVTAFPIIDLRWSSFKVPEYSNFSSNLALKMDTSSYVCLAICVHDGSRAVANFPMYATHAGFPSPYGFPSESNVK